MPSTDAALFDRSEVIGEGMQAALDMDVDESATKTAPVAVMPERGPKPMPGQQVLGDPRAILLRLLAKGYPAHNLQVREALTLQSGITLNGRPAQIVGALCRFPMVRDDYDGTGCEWSWEAALRIVIDNAGRFES